MGRRRIRFITFYSVVLQCLLAAQFCRADVIIGNLPGNDGVQFVFDSASALSVGFNVGPTQITVTSVVFQLNAQGTSGNASVEIRSNNGGSPAPTGFFAFDSQLITTGGVAQYTFSSALSPVLSANTTYWLTLGTSLNAPNALRVSASDPSEIPSGAYATFVGQRTGDPNDQTTVLPDPPFSIPSFQINGVVSSVAVPESPPWTGLLIGFALLGIFRRISP